MSRVFVYLNIIEKIYKTSIERIIFPRCLSIVYIKQYVYICIYIYSVCPKKRYTHFKIAITFQRIKIF